MLFGYLLGAVGWHAWLARGAPRAGGAGASGSDLYIFSMHYESKLRMVLGITKHFYIHTHSDTNSRVRRFRIENRHDYGHDHESDGQAVDLTAGVMAAGHISRGPDGGMGLLGEPHDEDCKKMKRLAMVVERIWETRIWPRGEPKEGGRGID
ncbi:hypothetical protein E4U54_001554 [Claviceps lovelessii]|nr:hypothetical protein E4U54_001554 [Claviceps lovelessii]